MSKKRPTTVPQEAIWNGSQNEWELGVKNEQGKYVGEWKWWLAPNGHLCCHTFFDDQGNILNFKRFHPNGEVSRYGTFENGKQIEDVYLKSSEPTTEVFAYGNTDEKVYKAVKRSGVPVSFDYYDKEGVHLNPIVEKAELIEEEEAELSEEELAQLKDKIYQQGKGFLSKQFDSDFYLETILPMIEDDQQKQMFDSIVRGAIGDELDFVFHEGDLEVDNLQSLDEIGIGVLVIKGDLIVKQSLSIQDDPMQLVLVTGNVKANNIVTSGVLLIFGDLAVQECLLGDYNHGSTHIGGNLTAKFFHPEEYFFEVEGNVNFTYAFGNSWRLNQNQNPEAFNYNEKSLSDFVQLLHPSIHEACAFENNQVLLEENCSEGGLFEFMERYDLMNYARANKPVFKN